MIVTNTYIAGGGRQHGSRGLCSSCYQRARRNGTIDDWPYSDHRWSSYADDYAMLRKEGYPLDVIATRLGMRRKALDHALCRHRDDPRARRPNPQEMTRP